MAFSASPNLFSIDQNGTTTDLVGIGQKSGVYWALNRDTGEVVWQQQISPAGFLGGMEGTAAVANGVIAVPATNWPEFDGPASGMVTALDAATGEILWTVEETAPAASPTSITNDVVLHAGLDGILHIFSLADGSEIWRNDLGASVSSGRSRSAEPPSPPSNSWMAESGCGSTSSVKSRSTRSSAKGTRQSMCPSLITRGVFSSEGRSSSPWSVESRSDCSAVRK